MKFGIDRLLTEPALRADLNGRRVALLGHPASVTADLTHSLDALMACPDLRSPPSSSAPSVADAERAAITALLPARAARAK